MTDLVAAIDCGTNSTRLLIGDGRSQTERLMRITRLGEGVDGSGRLASAAIERTCVVLSEFSALLSEHHVSSVRMTATSAARDAANRDDFFDRAESIIGTRPELLSGLDEGSLSFDGATGYLIGEEHQGMQYMFTMMNSARMGVGMEGLAVAERAYQQAVGYAKERIQGKPIGSDNGEASSIIEHPDVRRMLMTMKAYIEAMRGLLYLNAEAFDLSHHHPDESVKESSQELLELLTPISKAWCTDLGVQLTSLGLQVFGGMGYIEETGIAQHYRDARIAPIYEGTNGIQAMDLVGRKLPMRGGEAVRDLITKMTALDAALADAGEDLASIRVGLADGVAVLTQAIMWLAEHGPTQPNDALAGATPFLRLMGTVIGSWVMARAALAATELIQKGEGDPEFLEAKIATARFYTDQLLPQVHGLLPMVTAGVDQLFEVPVSQL